ncbi:carbamoyl-phosphate synthase small subunit [Pueribacillus theae]|uniref:Carbamoyl phosphate synthase small chain n=1 Tax=Pueribacillus theae TaxID=2171751 RepID=A0A2U1K5F7_9BACI|nr:glutamine-hydrolyzing carbamoyl-phosphate synthase small subunit [Pueribacillus theae]PWA12434.1 carbamoyl-phosphate synthase small subunit [Pueribacillus theae]
MQARLLLEDGSLFVGKAFGAEGDTVGEVVFNTGMTGYQELLTDPSYCGQIITMTYPLVGNYGITRDDFEAVRPFANGFVVRKYEEVPSNWRAQCTLDYFLKEYGIVGISEIDTRMLTRLIRQSGAMKGILSISKRSVEELMEIVNGTALLKDQVARVSTRSVYSVPGNKERIVLVDFGTKSGIMKELSDRGCDVVVVPHDTTAEQIRRLIPDGILLSNGPGNPKNVSYAVQMIQELLGEVPIFGICLGHQLFALACGADTEKLKFGHRGGNHPVKDLRTGKCYMTSQNHGYTVKEESIAGTGLEITHVNINDRTIEGLKHTKYMAFSVQYHPEASPGPFDSNHLFDDFLESIDSFKRNRSQPVRQVQMLAERKSIQQMSGTKGEAHYAEK